MAKPSAKKRAAGADGKAEQAAVDIDAAFAAAKERKKMKKMADDKREEEERQRGVASPEAPSAGERGACAVGSNAPKSGGGRFVPTSKVDPDDDTPDYVNSLKGVRDRRRTAEGYRIYSERELRVFDYQKKNAGYRRAPAAFHASGMTLKFLCSPHAP